MDISRSNSNRFANEEVEVMGARASNHASYSNEIHICIFLQLHAADRSLVASDRVIFIHKGIA